jgi:hypothetical protein
VVLDTFYFSWKFGMRSSIILLFFLKNNAVIFISLNLKMQCIQIGDLKVMGEN